MQIKVYENSLRTQRCREILELSRLTSGFERILILPIPTTRDGKHVSGTDTELEEVFSSVGEGCLVVGYGIPEGLALWARTRGAVVADSLRDEIFLLANAELTATAALGIILTAEGRAPSDLSVGIVGYGRIGRSLLYKLLYLGAHVRVYTTREDVMLELMEAGVDCRMSGSDASLEGLELLVNTAPAAIFESERIPEGLRVMELASGDNFPSHPMTQSYPALPARMYPESAGRIWAESVQRYLMLGESFGVENEI